MTAGASAQSPESLGASVAASTPAGEVCPLCGGSLGPAQDWCLRCGTAARTQLAASPNWKAPAILLAVVAAVALAVLAAALVKLAGGSGSGARSVTSPGAIAPAPSTAASTPLGATGLTPGTATSGPTAGAGTTAGSGSTAPAGPTSGAGMVGGRGVTPGAATGAGAPRTGTRAGPSGG